jgi:hypothetical protein
VSLAASLGRVSEPGVLLAMWASLLPEVIALWSRESPMPTSLRGRLIRNLGSCIEAYARPKERNVPIVTPLQALRIGKSPREENR